VVDKVGARQLHHLTFRGRVQFTGFRLVLAAMMKIVNRSRRHPGNHIVVAAKLEVVPPPCHGSDMRERIVIVEPQRVGHCHSTYVNPPSAKIVANHSNCAQVA
jgi:hypothetical protein